MAVEVVLRELQESDLPVLFEHQKDEEAAQMADFPPRNWERFVKHWAKISADPDILIRIIEANGQVAGNIVSFVMEGHREVGYWIGREVWGQGIATQALRLFLSEETRRPLYGYTVEHNRASQRVLEKCGFSYVGESAGVLNAAKQMVTELIYRLD